MSALPHEPGTTPEALEREAEELAGLAQAKRFEAAKLRAKLDREAGMTRSAVIRARPALHDGRHASDRLLAKASVTVETFPGGFEPRDLASKLGIADVARAHRLLLALAELEKVTHGESGWRVNDPTETAVRDYIVSVNTFTVAMATEALALHPDDLSPHLDRFYERGMIEETDDGWYEYVEVPAKTGGARPRRRPPEQDPPAFTEAPSRGLPIRIVDHGKAAQATTRHRMKLRQKRWEKMQAAKEQRK